MASIKKIEPGKYEVRWRTPEGKSRRKVLRGSPENARRFATNIESDKQRGVYVEPALGKTRVREWADRWLASVRGVLKPKTVASYESLIDSRIVPALGNRQLSNVKPSDVQQWVNDMLAEGLSASRIRQAHVTLKQMFDAAMRDGLLGRNAALGIKLPALQQREAAYYEPQVADAIADAMPEGYDLLVRILGTLGLRWGEAAALQRRHVDLMRRRLVIEQSLAETGGKLTLGPTKTHATRSVPLTPALRQALETHLAERVGSEPESLLFASPAGAWLRYRDFHRRVWTPTLRRLGVPVSGLHALRHSAAARMISAGASPKAVQTVLGHRSVAFTLTVYGHLFDSDLDDLAARLDEPKIRGARVESVSFGESEASSSTSA